MSDMQNALNLLIEACHGAALKVAGGIIPKVLKNWIVTTARCYV